MGLSELNLTAISFRIWCHPTHLKPQDPCGMLGLGLMECSCWGACASNPDLRVSTCVKVGDRKKGQDGKTKNIFSRSFYFGFLPKISHNELDLNNRSWRTPEWLGSLPKQSTYSKIQESKQKKALLACEISTEIKSKRVLHFRVGMSNQQRRWAICFRDGNVFLYCTLNCVSLINLTEVSTSGTKC